MHLPELVIGNLHATVPIIQGGMGVGVSLNNLAAAVANEGGIGIISGVQIGFREPDFLKNNLAANLRALAKEIRLAREKSPRGILGVNLMVAVNNYAEYVKTCVQEKIDLIISGAGLPLDLPKLTEGSGVKIAPIVSSAKAISLICRSWDKKYQTTPDLVVIEGPQAGGHLGFHKEELLNDPPELADILTDVKNELEPYKAKYHKKIPIVVAGGIFDGQDIARYLNEGADGVQMATRFVATYECDAGEPFKQAYLTAKKEDIIIVQSPVGMPGRAIRNKFIEKIEHTKQNVVCMYQCLKPCNPAQTPYCISIALINAVKGNLDAGLVFCGSNAYRVDRMTSVKELMTSLVQEAERYMQPVQV